MVTPVLDIDGALTVLARGGVIAVPTDTVYGVAAAFDSPGGIEALFELKRRPHSLALPVMVDSIGQITALGVEWPVVAQKLATAFWPGALTIIVRTPDDLARRVAHEGSAVGFRIPDLDVLRRLLARSGPLAVTSANRHAQPPCHSVREVLEVFASSSALGGVLDGGDCYGTVSTVVDVSTGTYRIVRPGAIGSDAIEASLG